MYYIAEGGYPEAFDVSPDVVIAFQEKATAIRRAIGEKTLSFERCRVTFSTVATGLYGERYPDISDEMMNDELRRVEEGRRARLEALNNQGSALIILLK